MANLQIPIPEAFQDELSSMLKQTVKEVLAETKRQELDYGRDFMSISETAKYMGCSVNTIHLWEREYGLKRVQIAGKSYIAKSTLISFLKSFEG